MNTLTLVLIVLSLFLLLLIGCSSNGSEKLKPFVKEPLQLADCPDKPNCINTENPDDKSHYLPPVEYPESQASAVMPVARRVIEQMGGKIVFEKDNYLAATFTSSVFKFIDDFELRQDISVKKLHIRSASRLGYTDFGVNKRRVSRFSELFKKELAFRR